MNLAGPLTEHLPDHNKTCSCNACQKLRKLMVEVETSKSFLDGLKALDRQNSLMRFAFRLSFTMEFVCLGICVGMFSIQAITGLDVIQLATYAGVLSLVLHNASGFWLARLERTDSAVREYKTEAVRKITLEIGPKDISEHRFPKDTEAEASGFLEIAGVDGLDSDDVSEAFQEALMKALREKYGPDAEIKIHEAKLSAAPEGETTRDKKKVH